MPEEFISYLNDSAQINYKPGECIGWISITKNTNQSQDKRLVTGE